jgi:hypothetical protein
VQRPAAAQVRALLAALAVLGVSVAIAIALSRVAERREIQRTTAEAEAGALRGLNALRALLAGFEEQGRAASANAPLVAALDAGIDRATLRDLLFNEPWLKSFRSRVDGFGVIRRGVAPEVSARLPENFDVKALSERARAERRPASGLRVAGGQVLAVVACPVTLTDGSEPPLLLATKIVDVGTLAMVAERATGAAAISDGRRILVGAGGSSAGAAIDLSEIKRLVSMSAPGATMLDNGRAAIAALPLDGELRLVVHVHRAPAAGGIAGKPWPIWVTIVIGLGAAVGVFLLLGRRVQPPPARPTTLDDIPTVVTSVGRYRVIDRIGLGGMVEIYSAVTTGEGGFRRSVVIKRLRPEFAGDPAAVAQFCGEANLLAALHHPNIVAVQDFGRAGEQLFLAEEYILGRDLGRLVKRCVEQVKRSLPAEVVAHVSFELLKALDYVHNVCNEEGKPLGIVHGDVSPENIMISSRGEVKLLDFGVAKATDGRPSRTETGVVKGNVSFMSPEQARGEGNDARSDLYATALVIYYCLVGKPLYESHTGYELLLKAGTGPGPEEWAAVGRVPARLAAVLRRALAPRLEQRYQSAREMAADLERLIGDGAQRTHALMGRLFGQELTSEARRLSEAPDEPAHRERMPT